MNEKNGENKQLEDLLRKAHPPEPTSELRERIITEAKKTWIQTSTELPWQVPIRRLIVSAAAAVLIIWLTNCSSDCALALWRSDRPNVAYKQSLELDELPELSYSPLARHLVSVGRKPSITEASILHNYAETMIHIFNEAQQNRGSKSAAPSEDRSQLFPTQLRFNSFS
jgi:hypothetical protein